MKLIGIVLCVFSCCMIGFYLGENVKLRYNSLVDIRRMITMIKGEIEYKKANISEAFYFVAKKMDEPYKGLLTDMYNKTLNNEGIFENMWEPSIEKHLSGLKLKDKDYEALRVLGRNIGYLGMEMQISNFKMYLEGTSEEIDKAKESMDKTIKLYRTLGLMAGIAISIILI